MPRLLARTALAFPVPLLVGLTALAAACLALSLDSLDRLDPDGLRVVGAQSQEVSDEIAEGLGREQELALVLAATSTGEAITSPASKAALRTIKERLRGEGGVAKARRGGASVEAAGSLFELAMAPDARTGQRLRLLRVAREEIDPGQLELLAGGRIAGLVDARERAVDDSGRALLLAAPVALLLLVFGLGLRLAAAPLIAAVLGTAATLLAIRGFDRLGDPTLAAAVAAVVVGALVSVETSTQFVRRHRARSISIDQPGQGALAASIAGVMKATAVASVAVGAAAAAFAMLLPIDDARSIALGVGLAVPIASIAAILVTAPMLALIGGPAETASTVEPGRIAKLLRGRRGAVISAAAVAVLVYLSLGLADVEVRSSGPAELPTDTPARVAEERIAEIGGAGVTEPIAVGLPGALTPEQVATVRADLAAITGVTGVSFPQATGDLIALRVRSDANPGSLEAQRKIAEIRLAVAGVGGRVGGRSAATLDASTKIADQLGLLVIVSGGIAALLIAALLGPIGIRRRLLGGVALGVVSLFPAAAAVGLTSFIFTRGHLSSLLDYETVGAPGVTVLVALAASLAAIGIFRGAQLVGALSILRGQSTVTAGPEQIRAAIGATVPAITVVSLIGVAAGLALASSDLIAMKELGVGLAAGLALDLVLARVVLTPAVLGLTLPGGSE